MQKLLLRTSLILLLAITSSALPLSTVPTSKTFFKASNSPAWLNFNRLPFTAQPKKPTEAILQSAIGLEGFYEKSRAATVLGNYFGFYDVIAGAVSPSIQVTANLNAAHSLTPQDIVHNSAVALNGDPFDVTTNPLRAVVTFAPYIEEYGLILSNSLRVHDWITIHTIMPWVQINHVMGLKTTSSVSANVEGNLRSVLDFFSGDLKQEAANSPDQQDPLQYGKLINRQSLGGLADITLLCLLSPRLNEDITAHIGALAVLPTTSRPHGFYLFEPTLGSGGHPLFGLYGKAETEFFALKEMRVGGSIEGTARTGITTQEVRAPSYLIGTADAGFGRYALGGKQNARRLFPLINLLTQTVSVKPGTTAELALGVYALYKKIRGHVEYRYKHTGAEKVAPILMWPAGVYALAQLEYAQTTGTGPSTVYNAFDVATDSAFANRASLSNEQLNYDAATTPAQATHAFRFSIQCTPFSSYPFTSFQGSSHYSFAGKTNFGIGSYGFSCSVCHTF